MIWPFNLTRTVRPRLQCLTTLFAVELNHPDLEKNNTQNMLILVFGGIITYTVKPT